MRQLQLQCAKCDAIQPHNQKTPRHVMHALLSLFVLGAWIPVWIFVAATAGNEPAVCVKCGNRRRPSGPATVYDPKAGQPRGGVVLAVVASVVVAAIAIGLIMDNL
jgi:hypothetical protein